MSGSVKAVLIGEIVSDVDGQRPFGTSDLMHNPVQRSTFVPHDVWPELDQFPAVRDPEPFSLTDSVHRGSHVVHHARRRLAIVDGHGVSLVLDVDTIQG